jgi:sugar lactone lactonase YvrE
MYIADSKNNRVRKVDPAGIITTFAGSSEVRPGVSGDGGPAVKAYLWDPMDVAIGPDGAIYIAESGNHRIRKVDRNGIITTVAGSGPGGKKSAGYSGDGGAATKARLRHCKGVTVAADGTIYIADTGNHCVRKVDRRGVITTVAGSRAGGDKAAGYSGDGGPATKARLCWPQGLALGADGSLYIADMCNGRIRKVCGVAAVR